MAALVGQQVWHFVCCAVEVACGRQRGGGGPLSRVLAVECRARALYRHLDAAHDSKEGFRPQRLDICQSASRSCRSLCALCAWPLKSAPALCRDDGRVDSHVVVRSGVAGAC